ncbi:MAG: FGGY family carbohydrate kinase [Actinobacteria bacterium]|nr:FGGY family carbohydrate kinase [Actinomycetota bacterium]
MHSKKYIIIDIGASNGRVIIGEFNGNNFINTEIYRFKNNPVFMTGILYWDILYLFSEIKKGIQLAFKNYNNIISAGMVTWGLDFGFFDLNGQLISNPVCYRDPARIKMGNKLYDDIISRNELFKLNGGPIIPSASLNYLYALKLQKNPELINAEKFLMIPDIFNYLLTGKKHNEVTQASTTSLFNLNSRTWEKNLLEKINISPDILGDIINPSEIIGNITTDITSELEIKPISVICTASHDTASEVAAIPVSDTKQCWSFINMGTCFGLGIENEIPIITDLAFKEGFYNESGVEGKCFFSKDINGLWTIQRCMERWMADQHRDISWSEIDNMVSFKKPFKSFINIDDEIFTTPNPDMPLAIADYCRNSNQNIPGDIGEISRCIYESMLVKLVNLLNKLEKIISKKIEIIYLLGGGSKNKLLCQWISNASSLPVYAGPQESASAGNLITQLIADKEIKNIEEGRKICKNSLEIISYEPLKDTEWEDKFDNYRNFLDSINFK